MKTIPHWLCCAIVAYVAATTPDRTASMQAPTWPRNNAQWTLDIFRTAGAGPDDLHWLELAAPRATVGIGLRVTSPTTLERPVSEFRDIQVRYLVHGVPVSNWLSTPFIYTLSIDHPGLDGLPDGLHDVSLDVQGPLRENFKPRPVFLHLARGRTMSSLVPIMSRDCMYCDYGVDFGPGVVYVNYTDAKRRGYPVDPSVRPWHEAPYQADLYQEEMAPHTDLFVGAPMWWEQAEGPHAGAKFVRMLLPKWDEDHRGLRVTWRHERFPFRDGPRGIAWMSPYMGGQVDQLGNLVFIEKGGPLRVMKPDGEVITVAGWRVKPDRDPIWLSYPVEVVRRNMELRGTWLSGQYADRSGFRTPLDVTIDPRDPRTYYVAGYEDHCIWKVVASADWSSATVSVFAGAEGHSPGFVDGAGTNARFNGPASLIFDPVNDVIYVADQDNDAIRKITRGGVVSTLVGRPGMGARLTAAGVTSVDRYTVQDLNRAAGRYLVSAAEAAKGVRPDIFLPQTIRVDSQGRVIVLELGFGGIRQIDPQTFETKALANVYQRFEGNKGDSRGWAWFDIDRYGNSGPLDAIYWTVFQASTVDGEPSTTHPNEAYGYTPPGGGLSRFIFNDWDPYPDAWGRRGETDPPHYGWMIAIDPRGAIYLAGGGEHGPTRLRARKPSDVVPPDYLEYLNGDLLWRGGAPDVGPALAMKFGSEAHNYLGFADAWAFRGASDAAIIAAFEIPPSVQADPVKLRALIRFIRLNGGEQLAPPTAPPPPTGPAPPTGPTPPATGFRIVPDRLPELRVGVRVPPGLQLIVEPINCHWFEIATKLPGLTVTEGGLITGTPTVAGPYTLAGVAWATPRTCPATNIPSVSVLFKGEVLPVAADPGGARFRAPTRRISRTAMAGRR